MKTIEAYESWKKNNKSGYTAHRHNVKPYYSGKEQMDLCDFFDANELSNYVFALGKKADNKRSALLNFLKHVNVISNKQFDESILPPIDMIREHDSNYTYKKRRKQYEAEYFPLTFEINRIFEDEYYRNINCQEITVIVKAILAMIVGAFASAKQLFNNTPELLCLDDIRIIGDAVVVSLKFEVRDEKGKVGETESEDINVTGILAKHIIDYYNVRVELETDDEAFFVLNTSHKRGRHHPNPMSQSKIPNTVVNWVTAVLEYICEKNQLPRVTTETLKNNALYQALVKSQGSMISEVLRVYGYPKFVKDSISKYHENCDGHSFIAYDFFAGASTSDDCVESDDEVGAKNEYSTYMTLTERKNRNKDKVLKLKELYENKCQICSERIIICENKYYSEVHHIYPVKDYGPDEEYNMLVLCPNHHTMFDLGVISLSPLNARKLSHVDPEHELNDIEIVILHNINVACCQYHQDNIYSKFH